MSSSREVARADPSGMLAYLRSMPDHLRRGYHLGASVDSGDPQQIAFAGVGGSAIAADVFCALARKRARVPLEVVRDSEPPAYLGEGDLLVAVSYSGATEETLSAAQIGLRKGADLVAITSGGRLRHLARAHRGAVIDVPTGIPPRAAFGYLFGAILGLGRHWLGSEPSADLESAAAHLEELRGSYGPEAPGSRNASKAIARAIRGKTAVVYGAPPYGPVAMRWKTQINENAKVHAFAGMIPEADHNEIVGWAGDPAARQFLPIFLRDAEEPPELRRRIDATRDVLRRRARVREVRDDGATLLGRVLGTLLCGDYVSVYLAILLGRDPTPTPPIEDLKRRLAS